MTLQPGRNMTGDYRIQGPPLVIKYVPETLGCDSSLHIQTMYRELTNDHNRKFTAK